MVCGGGEIHVLRVGLVPCIVDLGAGQGLVREGREPAAVHCHSLDRPNMNNESFFSTADGNLVGARTTLCQAPLYCCDHTQ